MTVALVVLSIIALGTIGLTIFDRINTGSWDAGPLVLGGACVALVLVIWFMVAVPLSSFQRDKCQERADGYGLEDSDWSIRHNCRVRLPAGQLVPESRIRITSDGQIIVTGDE